MTARKLEVGCWSWSGGVAGTRCKYRRRSRCTTKVLVLAPSQKVRLGMPKKLKSKSAIALIMMTLDERDTTFLLRHHKQYLCSESNSSHTI